MGGVEPGAAGDGDFFHRNQRQRYAKVLSYLCAMIVITGAAGFIGSALAARLNEERFFDLVLVDDFSRSDKLANHEELTCAAKIDRSAFFDWLEINENQVQFIFHLGARTDTTEQDRSIFDDLNYSYSQRVWNACIRFGIPLVYASSAATYGGGEHGYADDHQIVEQLKPLNPYGESKNDFDRWALGEVAKGQAPYFWAGLKFFNVFGPNEFHKGRMASVVFHTFNQVNATGSMKLFRSHREDYSDGGQTRDFVYVKDLTEVCLFLMHHRKASSSGLYNLGTGHARTFLDLAKATFVAMGKKPNIGFIDTPEDIRDTYQYFTEADMSKLRSIGFDRPFATLEDAIHDYVKNYLIPGTRWHASA
jgi:ADP-L-glycero-D-manno-heptose 6-epimerase